MTDPLVLAITGASGAVYAARLLQVLLELDQRVHLTISPAGGLVLKTELGIDVDPSEFSFGQLRIDEVLHGRFGYEEPRPIASPSDLAVAPDADSTDIETITCHGYQDFMSPIASGSFLTGGMVVCPCSGTTLSAIVTGGGGNLIHRAANVHLKERRPLILVPRETPLSLVHLDNMRRASELGAIVLPAMPGWYHGVHSLRDVIDFVAARILDQLGIGNSLSRRWGDTDTYSD